MERDIKKHMKIKDFFINFIMMLSVLFVFVILSAGWLIFIDGTYYQPPIDFESRILQTTKEVYIPGEMVQVRFRYLKNRSVLENVVWSLKSDILVDFSPKVIGLPEGKQDFVMDIFKIPNNSGKIKVPIITNKKYSGHILNILLI